jgi:hypothetical protein
MMGRIIDSPWLIIKENAHDIALSGRHLKWPLRRRPTTPHSSFQQLTAQVQMICSGLLDAAKNKVYILLGNNVKCKGTARHAIPFAHDTGTHSDEWSRKE